MGYGKTLQGGQSTSTAPAVNQRIDVGGALQMLFPSGPGAEAGAGEDGGGALVAAAIADRAGMDIDHTEGLLQQAQSIETNLLAKPESKLVLQEKEMLGRVKSIQDPLRRTIATKRRLREWMNSDAIKTASKAEVESIARVWDVATLDDQVEAVWGADLVKQAKEDFGVADTSTLLITMQRKAELAAFKDREERMKSAATAGDFTAGAIGAHVAGALNTSFMKVFKQMQMYIDQQGAYTSNQEQEYRLAIQTAREQGYEVVRQALATAAEKGIQVKEPNKLFKEVDAIVEPWMDMSKQFGDMDFSKRSKVLWDTIGMAPGIVQGKDVGKLLNMLKDGSMPLDEMLSFASKPEIGALMTKMGIPTLGQKSSEAAVRASLQAIEYLASGKADYLPDEGLRKLAKFYAVHWVGRKEDPANPISEEVKAQAADAYDGAANAFEFFTGFTQKPETMKNLAGNTTVIARTRNIINKMEDVADRGWVAMEGGKPVVYRPSKMVGDVLESFDVRFGGEKLRDYTVDEAATRDLQAAYKFAKTPGAEKLLGGMDEILRIEALAKNSAVLADGTLGVDPKDASTWSPEKLKNMSDDRIMSDAARISSTLSALPKRENTGRAALQAASLNLATEIKKRKLTPPHKAEKVIPNKEESQTEVDTKTGWAPPSKEKQVELRAKYETIVTAAEEEHSLPKGLLAALITQESGWDTNAESHVGAKGLTQLMPDTAKMFGVEEADRVDAEKAVKAGAKYLSQLIKQFDGDIKLALAAYNAGPGNVRKYNGIPPFPATQKYVANIMKMFQPDA